MRAALTKTRAHPKDASGCLTLRCCRHAGHEIRAASVVSTATRARSMVHTMDSTVLVIEDEAQMRRLLRASLPPHGYSLHEAATGREGLADAGTRNPDIILLDLNLPDGDGIEIARQLREFTSKPIIALSARDEVRDRVAVLDAGADDYVTKPFSMNELLARMRVARRHAESRATEHDELRFAIGALRVDLGRRQVFMNDLPVALTPIEYKLLSMLVRNAGRVITHQQLLAEVWGMRCGTQKQYLHVFMGRLRHKLEPEPARPRLLLTEPGVGYRLNTS
jgi:two-component system KDP operon response regulator KdpE